MICTHYYYYYYDKFKKSQVEEIKGNIIPYVRLSSSVLFVHSCVSLGSIYGMISKYIFRSSGQAEFSTPKQTFHGNQCPVFGLTHRPVSDSVNSNTSFRTDVKKYLQKYFETTKMWRRTVK